MKSTSCSQIFAIWASAAIAITIGSPQSKQSTDVQSSNVIRVTYNGKEGVIRGLTFEESFAQQLDNSEDIRSATIDAPSGYGCFFASEAPSSSSSSSSFSSSSSAVATGNNKFISPRFYSGNGGNYPANPFPTSFDPANPVVFPAAKYLSCFRLPVNVGSDVVLAAIQYKNPRDNTKSSDTIVDSLDQAPPGGRYAQVPYRLIPVFMRMRHPGTFRGSKTLDTIGDISRAAIVYAAENSFAKCRVENYSGLQPEGIFTTEQELQRTYIHAKRLLCESRQQRTERN